MNREKKEEFWGNRESFLEDFEEKMKLEEFSGTEVMDDVEERRNMQEPVSAAGEEETDPVELIIDPLVEKTRLAGEYLRGILMHMGLEARIIVEIKGRSIHIDIEGAEPGLVIGHRGQNLDALQHLVNRLINPGSDDMIPVTVDSDDYRKRRSNQLEHMVRQITKDVLSSGEEIVTDPMTPSERRLFHIAASHIRGIRTESFGNGFFQPIRVYPARESRNGNRRYTQDRNRHFEDPYNRYDPDSGNEDMSGEPYSQYE
jgi:spoIIIJ-associated protein